MASADTDNQQVDAVAAFLRQIAVRENAYLARDYRAELENVQRIVADLSARLQDQQRTRSRVRGRLRELDEKPALVPDMEAIAEQLQFIRGLRNVLDVRLSGNDLIIRITTWTLYEERWYDLGDYDISILGHTQGDRNRDKFRLECVRNGLRFTGCRCTRSCPDRTWATPLYWGAQSARRDGLGPGSFCFGNRRNSIDDLLREGQYAEFVHLVIATMCSVNQADRESIPEKYRLMDMDRHGRVRLRELMEAHVAVMTRTSL